jgi:hypothetical protein
VTTRTSRQMQVVAVQQVGRMLPAVGGHHGAAALGRSSFHSGECVVRYCNQPAGRWPVHS